MPTHFHSFATGPINKVIVTTRGMYVVYGGDTIYHCELVNGDVVFCVQKDGRVINDALLSIDRDAMIMHCESHGEVYLHSVAFLARVNE